jgi:glycosyltransferase involved in cell wall biosynthesis
VKPRVLFVGRTRYRLPLAAWLQKKWEALGEQLDYRVLASGDAAGDERFVLVPPFAVAALDGLAFYAALPFRIRRELRRFRPDAIVAENPHVAAAALLARGRSRVRVILEVHGDWRTATRLYGSPRRRALSPLADRVAELAVRRVDAVRVLSGFTRGLAEGARGRPVDAEFPTFSDLAVFAEREPQPLPATPTALFVGVLEPYKNVDGLAAAWRRVVLELPDARLVVVGKGSRRAAIAELVGEHPQRTEWIEELSPEEVAARMDASWVLVLPSRGEGLGRVVIESFARGRGVVASGEGGILDLVGDGAEGLLIDPDDGDSLTRALVRVLSDRALAERLGVAAAERYRDWHSTPERFAEQMRALVDGAAGR